jgi:hypothetical protein
MRRGGSDKKALLFEKRSKNFCRLHAHCAANPV